MTRTTGTGLLVLVLVLVLLLSSLGDHVSCSVPICGCDDHGRQLRFREVVGLINNYPVFVSQKSILFTTIITYI